jgi:hypothetical protein
MSEESPVFLGASAQLDPIPKRGQCDGIRHLPLVSLRHIKRSKHLAPQLTTQLMESFGSVWEVLNVLVGLVIAESHEFGVHAADLSVTEADLVVVQPVVLLLVRDFPQRCGVGTYCASTAIRQSVTS